MTRSEMTVKELIEILNKYDENTTVAIYGPDGAFLEVECRIGAGDCLLDYDDCWNR